MRVSKIRLGVLAAVSGLALGGCAYGFDGYGGYGGVNVGYGYSGYGYDPYGYGYGSPYGGYGYGYGDYGYAPYGWYDGFYYPGSGIYVYDSYRNRHAWNDTQRRYWQDRTSHWRDRRGTSSTTTNTVVMPRENWSGFNRQRGSETNRRSDNGRQYWGRSSSSSSSSSDTTTSSDNRWHGRGRGRNND
jgi:hypothetical protein